MILVDLNQVSISNLMAQTRGKGDVKPNKDMVRHMVLNSLRAFNIKFKEEFGEMVLCADAGNPWRREIFPNYKYSRRKGRDDGPFDWTTIFEIITDIKNEIKDNFPYKVMYVENTEADDIIATLVKLREEDKYLIISGDKDFIQLHKYNNVHQYSPIVKKHITGHNPDTYIRTHILKGDTSDGVPNVLSGDNTFTEGLRQRPLGKKKIEIWLESMDSMPDETKRNYQRNEKLINLDKIPQELEEQILSEIDGAPHFSDSFSWFPLAYYP